MVSYENPVQARNTNGIVNAVIFFLKSDIGKNRICVLVEGPDDVKTLGKFFNQDSTTIFLTEGKKKLQNALDILIQQHKNCVIGIRDADFCNLDNNHPPKTNLFFTDFHDIEMTMISFEDLLYDVFVEYDLQDTMDKIIQNVLQAASYIAYIRWYNDTFGCQIKFSKLVIEYFTNAKDNELILDHNKLLIVLNKRSMYKTEELTPEKIDTFIKANKTEDNLNLCNGHDVTALIALAINIDAKQFCDNLRIAFQASHFVQTKLYQNIAAWQPIDCPHIFVENIRTGA